MTRSPRSGSCCGPRSLRNAGPEPRCVHRGPESGFRRIERAISEVYGFLIQMKAPVGRSVKLAACYDVRRDRERGNKRAFFHVGHKGPWTICTDPITGCLSDSHLYGLVLHEFGHPLAYKLFGKSRQEDADQAIWKLTGIPILYRTGWTVQWITPGDVRRVRAIAHAPAANHPR